MLPDATDPFVQPKISGTALLDAKLGAKINIRELIEAHFGPVR